MHELINDPPPPINLKVIFCLFSCLWSCYLKPKVWYDLFFQCIYKPWLHKLFLNLRMSTSLLHVLFDRLIISWYLIKSNFRMSMIYLLKTCFFLWLATTDMRSSEIWLITVISDLVSLTMVALCPSTQKPLQHLIWNDNTCAGNHSFVPLSHHNYFFVSCGYHW